MIGKHWRSVHPGRVVILGFAATIIIGALLLRLPIAHEPGQSPRLADTFFTSASAVTVTGLTVVPTGETYSRFGELVIMLLMQLGGLGLMTLGSVLSFLLNRRLDAGSRTTTGMELSLGDGSIRQVIKAIAVFTVMAETISAVLLTIRFWIQGDYSIAGAIYLGVFHSISAFNNAGFALFDRGMVPYVTDVWVNLIIGAAVIGGGLGFPVVAELVSNRRGFRHWSLHTRLTIVVTVVLTVVGMAAIAGLEWSNPDTLGPLGSGHKLLASFFQSMTTRTAGFNTVDMHGLKPATLLLMVPLMVIGASSASTGGGLKASTIVVALSTTLAELRGERDVTLFNRRVGVDLQRQALALVVLGIGIVGTATFILVMLSPDAAIVELLFESASAFGTVGLSVDLTPRLDRLGQLVVVVLMFLGRVGPTTFGAALLLRPQPTRFRHPEETVLIG